MSVSSITSTQRLIISFCALPDEDVEQLRAADLDFYGSNSSGWSDSSAENDELPPAKRTRESAAAASSSSAAREAESENDDTEASSASGYGDADRGYISAKIRHLPKLGCGCTRKNHHLATPANNMEELMYSLEKGTKRDKNIFIMGEFSLGLREPATGARRRNFCIVFYGMKFVVSPFQKYIPWATTLFSHFRSLLKLDALLLVLINCLDVKPVMPYQVVWRQIS